MLQVFGDFEAIQTISAVDAVADRLRDRILDGQLPPEYQVTELDVAAHYRVSRPTAKGAITILVNDGLLRREANRPAWVPRLSPDDVRDLFNVRIPLEIGIVRQVIGRKIVPVGMSEAVRDIAKLDDAPPSRFVKSDLRFHRLMVDSLGSQRMTRVYSLIQGEIHLSMVQSHRVLGAERIAGEHSYILEAIVGQEEKLAVERMERHLAGACRDVAKYLDEALRERSIGTSPGDSGRRP